MIKLLRVDDRLLHGQIAFSWVRNLKINTILVADDTAAYDEFSQLTLGLSKPVGTELQITEIEQAKELLKQYANSKMNIMVIVGTLCNAVKLLEVLPQISTLNVGTVRKKSDTCQVTSTVWLTPEEIKLCQTLEEKGIQLDYRNSFNDNKK